MGVGKTTFKFSKSSITLDGIDSTVINLTRDNQSYTNKLSHGYGDIYTYPSGTVNYTWKPTAAQLTKFLEEVPAQKSRLIDVYLDTYNGSTKVGRDTHALTVTLTNEVGAPFIGGFTISDSNSITKNLDIIVDGKSKVTASFTATGKYGATIVKKFYKHGSNEYSDFSSLLAALPLTTTPTTYEIGYGATDSRGFKLYSYHKKKVCKYQSPHLDTFEVVRCNTSGTESDTGTKAKVIIKGSWAAMKVDTAYKNPATLKVGYKTKAATSYTYQTITVSAGTVNVSRLLSATLTAGTDYEFSVQLTDKFETYSDTGVGFSNVKNILYVSEDGKELVIGSDMDGNVLIDNDSVDIRTGSTVNATFSKNLIELGKSSTDSTIRFCDDTGRIYATNVEDATEIGFDKALTINSGVVQLLGNSLSMGAESEGDIVSGDRKKVSCEISAFANKSAMSGLYYSAFNINSYYAYNKSDTEYINYLSGITGSADDDGSALDIYADNLIRLNATKIWHYSYNTPKFIHSKSDRAISVGVGDGGTNRGIYDDENGDWMIYRDDNGKKTWINGLSYNFIYKSYAVTSDKSIAANSYVNGSTKITQSGYRPFGVAGTTVNNRYVAVNRAYLSGISSGSATLNWMVANHHSSAHSTNATVYVLWIRE